MLNPMNLLRLKAAFDAFSAGHPQLKTFWEKACSGPLAPGSSLEITVTPQEGKPLRYRMTVTEGDMALFKELQELEG